MRLIAVSMIRNEADILPDFLGHCAALFDGMLVVDHASTDGSSEILAAAAGRMPLSVFRFGHRAHLQSVLVTALAHEAFARGADWVFPIDADEFPMVESRAALLAALPGRAPAIRWRWRNLWPLGTAEFGGFDAARDYETLAAPASTVKVGLSRRLLPLLPRFVIGTGSHAVHKLDTVAPGAVEVGHLAHIPVRTPERFALKALGGGAATAATPGIKPSTAVQWRRVLRRPDRFAGPAGAADLRASALAYPLAPKTVDGVVVQAFAPLGRMAGLPPGLPDPTAVTARDAALRWQDLPPGKPETWRVILEPGHVRLEGPA